MQSCAGHPGGDTDLHNAIDNGAEGWPDEPLAGDPEQGVLEVPPWPRVRVGAAEDHVVLPVQRAVLALQLLQHLRGRRGP